MSTRPKDASAPRKTEPHEQENEMDTDAGLFEQADSAAQEGEETGDADAFLRLAGENEELKEKALRLAAEMENLRRRTQRDVAEARSYGIANFARDMLTVSDNLKRALEAVPAEARDNADAGLKALIEGVEMTERAMLSTLERHGVKRIEPHGERFDPHVHQAMFEIPDDGVPPGTVVQVVQAGYVIGERVLRPAMVGVAKAPPKAEPSEDGAGGKAPGGRQE